MNRKQSALSMSPAIALSERSTGYPMRGIIQTVRSKDVTRGKRTTVDVSLISDTAPTADGAKEHMLYHVPLKYQSMGKQHGNEDLPEIGDIAVVEFFNGNLCDPFVSGFVGPYNGEVMAETSADLHRSHRSKNGTSETIDKDGNYVVAMAAAAGFTVNGDKIALGGDFDVLQKLIDERFLALFNQHVHVCAAPGNPSAVPTVPLTAETCATIQTKAG